MPSWTQSREQREAERVEAKKARYGGRAVGGIDQPGMEPPRERDVTFALWSKAGGWFGYIPFDSTKACRALVALLQQNPIDQPHASN